jgi:hypothetical protein
MLITMTWLQGVDEVLFNEQGKAYGIKTGNEVN